jgi:hypothetical protein
MLGKTPENVDDARELISLVAYKRGEFVHNMLGARLRIIARALGQAIADQMVDEFDLTKRFGIHKEATHARQT